MKITSTRFPTTVYGYNKTWMALILLLIFQFAVDALDIGEQDLNLGRISFENYVIKNTYPVKKFFDDFSSLHNDKTNSSAESLKEKILIGQKEYQVTLENNFQNDSKWKMSSSAINKNTKNETSSIQSDQAVDTSIILFKNGSNKTVFIGEKEYLVGFYNNFGNEAEIVSSLPMPINDHTPSVENTKEGIFIGKKKFQITSEKYSKNIDEFTGSFRNDSATGMIFMTETSAAFANRTIQSDQAVDNSIIFVEKPMGRILIGKLEYQVTFEDVENEDKSKLSSKFINGSDTVYIYTTETSSVIFDRNIQSDQVVDSGNSEIKAHLKVNYPTEFYPEKYFEANIIDKITYPVVKIKNKTVNQTEINSHTDETINLVEKVFESFKIKNESSSSIINENLSRDSITTGNDSNENSIYSKINLVGDSIQEFSEGFQSDRPMNDYSTNSTKVFDGMNQNSRKSGNKTYSNKTLNSSSVDKFVNISKGFFNDIMGKWIRVSSMNLNKSMHTPLLMKRYPVKEDKYKSFHDKDYEKSDRLISSITTGIFNRKKYSVEVNNETLLKIKSRQGLFTKDHPLVQGNAHSSNTSAGHSIEKFTNSFILANLSVNSSSTGVQGRFFKSQPVNASEESISRVHPVETDYEKISRFTSEGTLYTGTVIPAQIDLIRDENKTTHHNVTLYATELPASSLDEENSENLLKYETKFPYASLNESVDFIFMGKNYSKISIHEMRDNELHVQNNSIVETSTEFLHSNFEYNPEFNGSEIFLFSTVKTSNLDHESEKFHSTVRQPVEVNILASENLSYKFNSKTFNETLQFPGNFEESNYSAYSNNSPLIETSELPNISKFKFVALEYPTEVSNDTLKRLNGETISAQVNGTNEQSDNSDKIYAKPFEKVYNAVFRNSVLQDSTSDILANLESVKPLRIISYGYKYWKKVDGKYMVFDDLKSTDTSPVLKSISRKLFDSLKPLGSNELTLFTENYSRKISYRVEHSKVLDLIETIQNNSSNLNTSTSSRSIFETVEDTAEYLPSSLHEDYENRISFLRNLNETVVKKLLNFLKSDPISLEVLKDLRPSERNYEENFNSNKTKEASSRKVSELQSDQPFRNGKKYMQNKTHLKRLATLPPKLKNLFIFSTAKTPSNVTNLIEIFQTAERPYYKPEQKSDNMEEVVAKEYKSSILKTNDSSRENKMEFYKNFTYSEVLPKHESAEIEKDSFIDSDSNISILYKSPSTEKTETGMIEVTTPAQNLTIMPVLSENSKIPFKDVSWNANNSYESNYSTSGNFSDLKALNLLPNGASLKNMSVMDKDYETTSANGRGVSTVDVTPSELTASKTQNKSRHFVNQFNGLNGNFTSTEPFEVRNNDVSNSNESYTFIYSDKVSTINPYENITEELYASKNKIHKENIGYAFVGENETTREMGTYQTLSDNIKYKKNKSNEAEKSPKKEKFDRMYGDQPAKVEFPSSRHFEIMNNIADSLASLNSEITVFFQRPDTNSSQFSDHDNEKVSRGESGRVQVKEKIPLETVSDTFSATGKIEINEKNSSSEQITRIPKPDISSANSTDGKDKKLIQLSIRGLWDVFSKSVLKAIDDSA